MTRRLRLFVPGSLGVVHALDLDQARLRVRVTLATLVAQVATPKRDGGQLKCLLGSQYPLRVPGSHPFVGAG